MGTTTGGEIIDQVLRAHEESPKTPIFWTRPELLALLNEGMIELCLLSGFGNDDQSFTLDQNENFQPTPTGIMGITNIAWNGIPLDRDTLEALDRRDKNWQARLSSPSSWAPVGVSYFVVQGRSAETVTLTTLAAPAVIGESTAIDMPEEYVQALQNYVFAMSRLKEGGEEFQQGMEDYNEFLQMCSALENRQIAREFTLWLRDLDASTGSDYQTTGRT